MYDVIQSNPLESSLGYGIAPSTFGELMQGVLPDNRDFLVTLPVEKFSRAYFEYALDIELSVVPAHKVKSLQIVERVLSYFGFPLCGRLIICSSIPEGKGLASSSADLVATARAVAASLNIFIPQFILEAFMSEIEPSDGVIYAECVSYYQRQALLRNYLGSLPPITILALDEGGVIDTIQFNNICKDLTSKDKENYLTLLAHMERAIRKKDIQLIGQLSMASAKANQKLLKNKYLEHFIDIAKKVNCAGVAIAHSGTYIGLLFDANDIHVDDKLNLTKETLKSDGILETLEIYRTI